MCADCKRPSLLQQSPGQNEYWSIGEINYESPLDETQHPFGYGSTDNVISQIAKPLRRYDSEDGQHKNPVPGNPVPGMEYYRNACKILDKFVNGHGFLQAQGFLLAGLYCGQLACVEESMHWYSRAGSVIHDLLDPYNLYDDCHTHVQADPDRYFAEVQRRVGTGQHNLIVLASWTCLQLESEVLADVHLTSSNMQDIEHRLLMPLHLHNTQHYPHLALDVMGIVGETQKVLSYTSPRNRSPEGDCRFADSFTGLIMFDTRSRNCKQYSGATM